MVRYGWELPGQGFSFRDDYNNQTTLIQIDSTRGQWIGFGGNTEVYYDINPYNSIVSNISYRGISKHVKIGLKIVSILIVLV